MTRYQFGHTSTILLHAAESPLLVSSSKISYIQKDDMK